MRLSTAKVHACPHRDKSFLHSGRNGRARDASRPLRGARRARASRRERNERARRLARASSGRERPRRCRRFMGAGHDGRRATRGRRGRRRDAGPRSLAVLAREVRARRVARLGQALQALRDGAVQGPPLPRRGISRRVRSVRDEARRPRRARGDAAAINRRRVRPTVGRRPRGRLRLRLRRRAAARGAPRLARRRGGLCAVGGRARDAKSRGPRIDSSALRCCQRRAARRRRRRRRRLVPLCAVGHRTGVFDRRGGKACARVRRAVRQWIVAGGGRGATAAARIVAGGGRGAVAAAPIARGPVAAPRRRRE